MGNDGGWTGCTDELEEGTWVWSSTNRSCAKGDGDVHSSWYSNHPRSGYNRNCASSYSKALLASWSKPVTLGWESISCNTRLGFTCERRPIYYLADTTGESCHTRCEEQGLHCYQGQLQNGLLHGWPTSQDEMLTVVAEM